MSGTSATCTSSLTDLLFEERGVGRCLVAPDGTVLRANSEWLRSMGFTLDEVLGADIIELFSDARDMALAMHARARAGHRVEVPRHAQQVQGREKWWDGSIAPVPMEGGTGLLIVAREIPRAVRDEARPYHVYAPFDDLAERKRAEEALWRSRERARAASKIMRDHLVVLEVMRGPASEVVDWRYVDANEAALELLGTTRERLIGGTLREVLGEGAAPQHERLSRVLATGEQVRYEAELRDRAFLVTLFRFDANTVGSAAFEITERRRSELALRESEARYRMLFDSIDEGFCIIEVLFDAGGQPTDYRFIEVNGAFEKQTGLVDATGKLMSQLAPQLEAHWFETYGRVALTGEPIRFENRAEALGRTFDVYAFRVGGPESRRVAVLFNDISERRRAEASLREADRRKTDFLAVLSHELRNPLAPIRNSLVLLDRAPPGSDMSRRARDVLHRQTEHLTRLVDDLLDMTRITHGKVELQIARVDARDVVRRACVDVKNVFELRGIEVQYTEIPESTWVDADAARLAQMVGNLLNNALKFTQPGGQVHVVVRKREETCEVSVRDTGMGIEHAEMERIFEPFWQAERTRHGAGGGLGLGLALVRGLAAKHGGSVRATSAGPDQGAELILTLPLAAAASDAASEVKGGPGVSGLSALIVEDNEDAGATLADLLALNGHEVKVVTTGRAGIEAVSAHAPDVLISDIGLPDLNGFEVIRAVRAAGSCKRVFAIALTGYAQPEDRQRALDAGFDAHLPKPPPLDELNELLAEAAKKNS